MKAILSLSPFWLCCLLLSLFSANVAAKPRIVSAGGSLTEIIYALGAEDLLVGVDSSSQYPRAATALPDIGYFRSLNVEGVLSVKPDQLLLLQGSGPQAVLDQFKALGLKTTMINNPKTISGLYTTIEQIAKATDKQAAGKQLSDLIKQALHEVLQQPKLRGKKAVFLMSAGERGLVAAGQQTAPQLIFAQLGIENPFAELTSYKPISVEALVAAKPDVILLASHTSRGTSVAQLCQSPQLKLWASQQGCNLHKVDSLKFMGLSPRLPQAMQQTRQLFSTEQ